MYWPSNHLLLPGMVVDLAGLALYKLESNDVLLSFFHPIHTVWSVARTSAVKSENVTLRNEIATQ